MVGMVEDYLRKNVDDGIVMSCWDKQKDFSNMNLHNSSKGMCSKYSAGYHFRFEDSSISIF